MIGLVADDVTGACDSASPFLRGGDVLVGLWPALPQRRDLPCLALATDGRDQPAAVARERARAATGHVMELGAQPYKKVDSLLRGHVAEELLGVLEAWTGRVLLCPALPAEGRFTANGRQRSPAGEIDLGPIAEAVGPRLLLRDATSDAELDRVAAEVLDTPDLLPAGSAGLAAALGRALHPAARALPPLPLVRSPLGLVGSKTEVTGEQVERALAAGAAIRRRAREEPVDLDGHDALFLSGGGTAHGVLAAIGAEALELLGDVVPRAPAGTVVGGPHAGLLVCVKSGGFGPPDAIATIFRRLTGGG